MIDANTNAPDLLLLMRFDPDFSVLFNWIKNKNLTVTWNSSALPDSIQSLTIENCNLDVIIESEEDVRMTDMKAVHDIFEHFDTLKIRNITSLRVGPLLSGLLLKMKGELKISIEDVQNITSLPKDFLICHGVLDEDLPPGMDSLNFEMKNVAIESVDKNVILCNVTTRPVNVIWDNVTVQNIESEAISLLSYDNETSLRNYHDRKVRIINSSFEDLPFNVITGMVDDFQFIDNSVQLAEECFINIVSININITNNEFNHLKNYSFSCIVKDENATLNFNFNKINTSEELSMHFGTYVSNDMEETTSFFENNTFKCLNSAWMRRSNNEKEANYSSDDGVLVNYADIEMYENFLYDSIGNECSDVEIECMKSIKDFRHDYLIFNDKWEYFCSTEYNWVIFAVAVIIILAIGIVISVFVYCYTKGNFTPHCIDSSREYEVYLAEQQRPTYVQEEGLAEPIEIELKNDDEIKIKTSR